MKKVVNQVQWHPACYAALNLEFKDNRQDLDILQEQAINELPLRIDTLILKKDNECIIENEIGQIFSVYNLVEYKSSYDELNFDVFLKGIAQAYLYKVGGNSKKEIQLEEITLSFIRERKPIKLFKLLKKYGFIIEERFKGIYYITGKNLISIQIIVSKRLSEQKHKWINALSDQVSEEQAKELISLTNQLETTRDKKFADVVWEVITKTNRKLIKKLWEDGNMCQAMVELFKKDVDKIVAIEVEAKVAEIKESVFNDGFNDGADKKGCQIFMNMIKKGIAPKDAQVLADISDELVEKALAKC